MPAAAGVPRRASVAADEPPVVRISIGRIEVRVTQPAAATQRTKARPAVGMSLESYLERRERGGR